MIETTKLHCTNDCHGNIKMKSYNLPIVIYRASTAESLGRLLECLKCYITYVICAVVTFLLPHITCVTCNRPLQVFPRGLPKFFNNLES